MSTRSSTRQLAFLLVGGGEIQNLLIAIQPDHMLPCEDSGWSWVVSEAVAHALRKKSIRWLY
jgi:hypothetical protein